MGSGGALNVPVRHLFGQLRVAVAGQEFDGVGRHTWLGGLLLQLEFFTSSCEKCPNYEAHQSWRWDELIVAAISGHRP